MYETFKSRNKIVNQESDELIKIFYEIKLKERILENINNNIKESKLLKYQWFIIQTKKILWKWKETKL